MGWATAAAQTTTVEQEFFTLTFVTSDAGTATLSLANPKASGRHPINLPYKVTNGGKSYVVNKISWDKTQPDLWDNLSYVHLPARAEGDVVGLDFYDEAAGSSKWYRTLSSDIADVYTYKAFVEQEGQFLAQTADGFLCQVNPDDFGTGKYVYISIMGYVGNESNLYIPGFCRPC